MTARVLVMLVALVLPLGLRGAATVQVLNFDGPGEGFNDPTPAVPVGGNPGTTIGQQRQLVFLVAANIWGSTLTSNQIIRVAALFDALPCTATSAVLGGAAPFWAFADEPGLPPNLWFPAALAEKIADSDIGAATGLNFEVIAQFNSAIGQAGCLPAGGWYYGFDGNTPPGQSNLLTVVLHEFGHGLGFTVGPTNGLTGDRPFDIPSVWEQFVKDLSTNKLWIDMTGSEIVASAVNTNNLVWTGPNVQGNVPMVLGFRTELSLPGPNPVRGEYEAQPAAFGPALTQSGVKDKIVPAVDTGGPSPTDGCEPLSTAGAQSVKGRIALIDRGTCTFVQKVLNAQAAGAVGVVIANNVPVGLPSMGGSEPTVAIPSIGVTQAVGQMLRSLPQVSSPGPSGIPATLRLSSSIRAGTTDGFARLYAPNPYESGSSVSH